MCFKPGGGCCRCANQSQLLTGVIVFFVGGYLVLSFWLFYHGLRFIAKFPGLGAVLTERLMYTLFAFLFALLLLSNLVISYTNLFRNRETAFLLTLPVSDPDHFPLEIHRIHGAGVVGVYIFDRAVAGGVRAGARRAVAFLSADAAVDRAVHHVAGRVRCVRWPSGWAGFWTGAVFRSRCDRTAVVLLAVVAFWWKAQPVDDDLLDKRTLEALDQLLAKTRFTMFPFLPSYWLSAAVLQWAEGIPRGAVFSRWCC